MIWIVGIMFGMIALWSVWAVVAAIQGHRRRRDNRILRSHRTVQRMSSWP